MTRRAKFIVYPICVLAGMVGGFLLRTARLPLVLGLVAAAFLIIAGNVAWQVVRMLPLRRRVEEAAECGDADGLERALDELAVLWAHSPRGLAAIDANRAIVHVLREQYDDAVVVGRRALQSAVAKKMEASIVNNLAWALGHTGKLDEAVELAERALAGVATNRLRSFVNGTLGGLCALRGEADRALRHLDEADALHRGGPAIDATRQYYRGVALEVKGQTNEAVEAYRAARTAAPHFVFGRKAAVRLADLQSGS